MAGTIRPTASSAAVRGAQELVGKAAAVKVAARRLGRASTDEKNRALRQIAAVLRARESEILAANERDCRSAMRAAEQTGGDPLLDRLTLTSSRLQAMAQDVESVAGLPDPIGEEIERTIRPNGLIIARRRVPLGVVGVVYESRPNVTSDIAALCIKTGNGVLLRGGSEALESNTQIVDAIKQALNGVGLPADAVALVGSTDRDLVGQMLKLRKYLDVIIPRGGEGLIRFVVDHATVPVIETGAGVCHTYVDRSADPEMAARIAYNAKVRRPTICNALDTLLVHREIAPTWLPQIAEQWANAGVELRTDQTASALLTQAGIAHRPAVDQDWGREFLALGAAVKVVEDLDEALAHIRQYGSGHSEAIVTGDDDAARQFVDEVDAAAVYVNASTQFTDGAEFGLGAEVGISTQKMHARGPMGLRELTTYKWVVLGTGQTRP
jgi:glutamate-5-semialdehyde dehydrogenase